MEENSRGFEIIVLIKVTLSAVSLTVEQFSPTQIAAEWLRLLTDTIYHFFFFVLTEDQIPRVTSEYGLTAWPVILLQSFQRRTAWREKNSVGGHLIVRCNKKTILKDPENLSKAAEPPYRPAAAMRGAFMPGPPWPD